MQDATIAESTTQIMGGSRMLRDGKVWGCCCALLGSVALLSAGPANAENYADLEERIAELEATTARKGNRKLSLEISGQINQGILYWDDGGESNAYIVTNENSRSRFRFKG